MGPRPCDGAANTAANPDAAKNSGGEDAVTTETEMFDMSKMDLFD